MLLKGLDLLSMTRNMAERVSNIGYEVPEFAHLGWDVWEVRRYAPTVVRGFVGPGDAHRPDWAFYAEVAKDCRASFRLGRPSAFSYGERTADMPLLRVRDGATAELDEAEHSPSFRLDRDYAGDTRLPSTSVDCGDPANAQWIILDLYRELRVRPDSEDGTG